ncbi:MAG: transporter [Bacteroidales bacterium]
MITFLKNWMLPIAMFAGIIFYSFFSKLTFLTPYLIFSMLFLTFSRLSPTEIKFSKLHFKLITFQLLSAILIWLIFYPINRLLGESGLICFLAPTATAAAVVTGLLGGSVSFITTYVFMSNIAIAILAPFLFSYMGAESGMTFMESVWLIFREVVPLLMAPLLLAWLIRYFSPKLLKQVQSIQGMSFYIWAFALMIVVGKTVNFMIHQERPDYLLEALIAMVSLVACLLQFFVGRRMGAKSGEVIAAGQSVGQKNTILAIWMSHIYLNPIVSIAPASYVLWQNIINSYQLWKARRKNN